MSEFDDFLSLENFQLAWRRINTSPRHEVKNRLGIKVFSVDINEHLRILISDIREGNYMPSAPRFFYKPKKRLTLRPFVFLDMRDRLVYQAIGNIIHSNAFSQLDRLSNEVIYSPVLQEPDSEFMFQSALPRYRNPGQFRRFRDKRNISRNNRNFTHYVRADISAYYPSVDHNLLINFIRNRGWLSATPITQTIA